jgi:uncharacterized protein (DUF736 family)
MTTEKYLQSLINTSGHLNPNPNKKTDKHPDYIGYLKIENIAYRISAWVKSGKDNKKFLSLKVMDTDNLEINEI